MHHILRPIWTALGKAFLRYFFGTFLLQHFSGTFSVPLIFSKQSQDG